MMRRVQVIALSFSLAACGGVSEIPTGAAPADTTTPDAVDAPEPIAIDGDDAASDVVDSGEDDVAAEPDAVSIADVVTSDDAVDLPDDIVEPDDTEALDSAPLDTEPSDVPPEDVPVAVTCAATATVTSPLADEFFSVAGGLEATAQVVVSDGTPMGDLRVRWFFSGGVELGESPVLADGSSSWTGPLPVTGKRILRARVVHVSGSSCDGPTAEVNVQLCKEYLFEPFEQSLDPLAWAIEGDAYWDSGGWLEMTGLLQGQKGAIYSTAPEVTSGNVSLRFRYSTGGGGDSTGADGFAATFMKAEDLAEMVSWVQAGDGGGGLGYGAGGPYGAFTGSAFTVEIDTWFNQLNDAEYHTDPTTSDHIELTQGLDPSASIGSYALPDIETLEWHSIRVDIADTHIKVVHDGVIVLDLDVPDFQFRGGYVYFSGSTGYYYNYHRFDDLEIFHGCLPGPP